MRSTLYEALEVEASSETPVIRVALRKVLRRFWSAPRDASGDSEEAVRFVALASSILTSDERRERYDVSARPSADSLNPWRTEASRALQSVIGAGGSNSVSGALSQPGAVLETDDDGRPLAITLPNVDALANPLPDESFWADGYVLSAFVLSALLLLGGLWFLLGASVSTAPLIGLWVFAVVAIAITVFPMLRAAPVPAPPSLSRLAIVKWRRESSVFLGIPAPQQDTAWIFRLRMMELTRGAAELLTQPSIAARLLARCVDYALIAALVLSLLWAIAYVVSPPSNVSLLLRSPLLLPILVVAFGIVFDAVFITAFRTTPGKWLVGALVVTGVTQSTDQTHAGSARQLAWRRALVFAKSAMVLGVWPMMLARLASTLNSVRSEEGAWNAAADDVVVVRRSALLAYAAAINIVLAALCFMASIWIADAKQFTQFFSERVESTRKTVTDALPDMPTLPTDTPVAPPSNSHPGVNTDPAPMSPATAAHTANESPQAPSAPIQAAAPVTQPSIQARVDAQARSVQERRTRIDRAAALVAKAKESGRYGGLQSACERWTQDQPANAEAWRCLGLSRFQSGEGRAALPALRESLKLEPNDAQVEAAILGILRP